MNRCGHQQKSVMGAACEEQKRMAMVMDMDMKSVVCPTPRRLSRLCPLRVSVNNQTEMGDSGAGAGLLDIILSKGGYGAERPSYLVASSPPFYCGSPPSRASNPVIQDAQFGNEKVPSLSPAPPSPSSVRKGGGCVRMNFGQKPAAVRIEGFDCFSRDRQNCSISALA